jgi:DNA-binding SARP family transcriptional activator
MARASFQLLGSPSAAGVKLRGHKPWALLAYLAVERRPVHRDELMTLLWSDTEDPAAALRWNLAQARLAVSDPDALRGNPVTLPDDLVTDVSIVIDGPWTDAVSIGNLTRDLLEGVDFPTSPAFEMWLIGARRRVAASVEAMLREATLASLAAGDTDAAIAYANDLVLLAPLVDDHHVLLVRAYSAAGDDTAARQHLESAVRLFRAELGIDPAPAVFLAAEAARRNRGREPNAARIRAVLEAARAQVVAGSVDSALQLLESACIDAAAIGDVHLEAEAQFDLGFALVGAALPRHTDAELALHTAIERAERAGDVRIAAAAYRYLAASDFFRGIYGRALARLDRAEALHDGSDAERVELSTLRGAALVDLGRRTEGIEELRCAIAADPDESHGFLPILLTHAGRAHIIDGDLTPARRQLEHGHRVASERGWAGATPGPQALLGHVAILEQRLDDADELLHSAFESACLVEDPCWETWSTHGLARLASTRGDNTAALAHYADVVIRSDPSRGGHLWSRVWALADATTAARSAGDDRAERWYEEALVTAQRCGMRDLVAVFPSELNAPTAPP